jgi:hypothetical protein
MKKSKVKNIRYRLSVVESYLTITATCRNEHLVGIVTSYLMKLELDTWEFYWEENILVLSITDNKYPDCTRT